MPETVTLSVPAEFENQLKQEMQTAAIEAFGMDAGSVGNLQNRLRQHVGAQAHHRAHPGDRPGASARCRARPG